MKMNNDVEGYMMENVLYDHVIHPRSSGTGPYWTVATKVRFAMFDFWTLFGCNIERVSV